MTAGFELALSERVSETETEMMMQNFRYTYTTREPQRHDHALRRVTTCSRECEETDRWSGEFASVVPHASFPPIDCVVPSDHALFTSSARPSVLNYVHEGNTPNKAAAIRIGCQQ